MDRVGGWIQTYTGRRFWPLDPRADEAAIADIAHALSMQCRFAGHCLKFYSVAEHSVILSQHVPREHRLWALLHDASEAYLVDVPRPIKPHLTGYYAAEAQVMAAVCDHFGLGREMPADVYAADFRILGDERANLSACAHDWEIGAPEPLGAKLHFWSPAEAERMFLGRFRALVGGLA